MQKLWFIDKNTGENAVVAAEKTENGAFSFFYQGKRYTVPVELVGKRIYICTPEKPREKERLEEIFYHGEYFKRVDGQWVSGSGIVPKGKYQSKLSDLYQKRCRHYHHPVEELTAFARKQQKDAAGIQTAIRALEIAMPRASAGEVRGFLALLCGLYRRAGIPSASTSLYDYAMGKYGRRAVSQPFLTSVSAAFMDVGDLEMADIVSRRAFALDGGDAELDAFSQRFRAATRPE